MQAVNWESPLVWIGLGMALLLAVLALAPRLSPQARLDRRRRRSNARIVSKSARRTVKFSVRTKDK